MKLLFNRVFDGVDEMYALAEKAVAEASQKIGDDAPVAFPNTAYFLANIYANLSKKVTNFGELKACMPEIKSWMRHEQNLTDAFDSGYGTVMAAEVIEACKFATEKNPYPFKNSSEADEGKGMYYHGAFSDAEVRELGVPLVTGDIPGFVVIIGPAPSDEEAEELIKGYQSRGIFVFLIGGVIDQATRRGLSMGFPVRVVPVGPDIWCATHIVSVVNRAAMIFGNVQPGDREGFDHYSFHRIRAFINAFDPVSDLVVGAGGAVIGMGFPVITNDTKDMWAVPKSLIIQENTKEFIETSLEARDIKIKVTNIDIPVAFSSAFEGEIVRRGDTYVDVDSIRRDCFELCQMKELHEVEDHKITLVGKDIDELEKGEDGILISLGYIVEVAGKGMQSDFEPVIERKFHQYLNCVEGVMHTGQRDFIRIRISKAAFEAGFRAKHIGEVLYAKVMSDYDTIVDRCQVTIYTDMEELKNLRHFANEVFDKRDARLSSLTDESVEVFYNCILCQSFSPSHVCVVTPERLGLCGAVSWLDAKATNELDPNGPCQVVTKQRIVDDVLGIWEDVNEAVNQASHGALTQVTLYSIMQDPMTSCGCFECICGVEPLSGGVVIVHREHTGMTPLGMTFSEMASMTGGGVQTPGFMGHGKQFIGSKKFMAAEGGPRRIVWMPQALKELVGAKLNANMKDLFGVENFTDMIADESITEDAENMMNFLNEHSHPVLEMENLLG